jgi:competence protein ComEA
MRTANGVNVSMAAMALTLVASGAFVVARDNPAPVRSQQEALPAGPGRDITLKVCSGCHQPGIVASLRLTREGWAAVVKDMVKEGAKGTDAELAQVVDYLSTNFVGEAPRPINLNTAPAIDLESVAGLLRSEARALIAYREKTPCKSLDDLKNVPGLDFKKIEAAKDRVVCILP